MEDSGGDAGSVPPASGPDAELAWLCAREVRGGFRCFAPKLELQDPCCNACCGGHGGGGRASEVERCLVLSASVAERASAGSAGDAARDRGWRMAFFVMAFILAPVARLSPVCRVPLMSAPRCSAAAPSSLLGGSASCGSPCPCERVCLPPWGREGTN